MEYMSNYEVITCHSREKNWIDKNKETRNYFTGRIKEELGSIIRLTIAKSLGKALCENITQDNSNEEIGGFKYFILNNLQIMKHEEKLSRMT